MSTGGEIAIQVDGRGIEGDKEFNAERRQSAILPPALYTW
jgi:hypothetical protein